MRITVGRTRRQGAVAAFAAFAALLAHPLMPSAAGAPSAGRAVADSTLAAPVVTVTGGSAVLALPPGPIPSDVPSGIGKRLYLTGRERDFASSWAWLTSRNPDSSPEFGDLAMTRGVVIWAIDYLATDPVSHIGGYVPGRTVTRFPGSAPSYPGLATTTGGLIATGLEAAVGGPVPIYTTAGKVYPPTYQAQFSLPSEVNFQSVGGMFVFQDIDQQVRAASSRYPPGSAPGRRAAATSGGGNGWVATREGAECYRTAPLMSPTALRARICSQVLPMLNDDGTKAVVVQGRHVRLYDTRTGIQINATNAPTLAGWSFDITYGSAYELVTWLDADSYLVNVRDGTALALLRCSARTRACHRAVTSHTRSGVTHIVS